MCFAQNVYDSFEVLFHIFTGFVFHSKKNDHMKNAVVNLFNKKWTGTTSTNLKKELMGFSFYF
jgi:hypothetical protein